MGVLGILNGIFGGPNGYIAARFAGDEENPGPLLGFSVMSADAVIGGQSPPAEQEGGS
jgi:hypothetical protein